MPNIQTYTNDVRVPVADRTGSQAFEQEGRTIKSAFSEGADAMKGAGQAKLGAADMLAGTIKNTTNDIVQQVQQHYEVQDSNSVSVAGAKAFADLSGSLRSTMANADPNHADEAADNWRDTVMEEALGNIGADVETKHGREMAQRAQATLREEFTRQSMGAASTLSGQAVIQSVNETANGLAQAVSNDPSLLPTATAYLHGALNDQIAAHGSLSPDEVARARSVISAAGKHIGQAAFETMAQRNPDAAKEALKSGTFAGLFNGEEIGTLGRYADMQSKAAVQAQKAQIEQQKQADKADFNAQASQVVGSMLQPDGSLRIAPGAPQQIVKLSLHPGAAPGEIKSLADMTQAILKDQAKGVKAVSDPATYQSFGTKMVQGNLSAQEIYEARTNGQLSDKDTSYFIRGVDKLAQDPARKEAEKQFNQWAMAQKPAFTAHSLFGTADPAGMQKFNQFMQDAHARFDQAYSSKGDWQGLLNAKNPGYLGSIAKGYMSNVKGASLPPPPHFDAGTVEKGYAALKSGQSFIGPDGKLRVKP